MGMSRSFINDRSNLIYFLNVSRSKFYTHLIRPGAMVLHNRF